MPVATYTYDALPPAEKTALPPVEAATNAFTGTRASDPGSRWLVTHHDHRPG
jgi:hypothetical protein